MQCPTCGSAIAPGDAFCPTCGSDVSAISQAAPPPPPPGAFPGVGATAPMPPAASAPEPPPFPGASAAPTQPMPPAQQSAPATPYGSQPGAAGAPTRPMSTGAIIGIISAVIVGVVLLGVGGFFAYGKVFAPKSGESDVIVAKPDPSSLETSPSVSVVETESVEESASSAASSTTGAEATPQPSATEIPEEDTEPGVVTDAEARSVVKKFMDLRVARKINASKQYCTKKMLTGENGQFINDKYWRPDSYKIKKTTPDLMYIHVAVMGQWPSGNEPTIYSVFRDPKTGKVLIDDMIDPETSPDLWK